MSTMSDDKIKVIFGMMGWWELCRKHNTFPHRHEFMLFYANGWQGSVVFRWCIILKKRMLCFFALITKNIMSFFLIAFSHRFVNLTHSVRVYSSKYANCNNQLILFNSNQSVPWFLMNNYYLKLWIDSVNFGPPSSKTISFRGNKKILLKSSKIFRLFLALVKMKFCFVSISTLEPPQFTCRMRKTSVHFVKKMDWRNTVHVPHPMSE